MESWLLAVDIEYEAFLQDTRIVSVKGLCLDRLVWAHIKYSLGETVEFRICGIM